MYAFLFSYLYYLYDPLYYIPILLRLIRMPVKVFWFRKMACLLVTVIGLNPKRGKAASEVGTVPKHCASGA